MGVIGIGGLGHLALAFVRLMLGDGVGDQTRQCPDARAERRRLTRTQSGRRADGTGEDARPDAG